METRELGRSGIAVSRVILGCGNFGGVGSSPAFFGQGIRKDEAFRIMDAAWELGITTFDTADAYGGGRSETLDRRVAGDEGRRGPRHDRDRDEDLQPDRGRRRSRPRARHASCGRSTTQPRAARRRARRRCTSRTSSTRTSRRRRRCARSTSSCARARSARSVRPTSRAEQLAEARRDLGARGPRALRVRPELLLLLERGDEDDRPSRLPRARARLRGVRPARGRLADGEVPARRAVSGRLAHDAAARVVPALRERPGVRRARGARAGGARARRLDGRARDSPGSSACRT